MVELTSPRWLEVSSRRKRGDTSPPPYEDPPPYDFAVQMEIEITKNKCCQANKQNLSINENKYLFNLSCGEKSKSISEIINILQVAN